MIKNGNNPAKSTTSNNPQQLEALFNNATIGIVMANQKGEIINFNHYAEHQFGYYKEEVLGKPVEILIPYQYKEIHPSYKTSFFNHPQTGVMGAGRNLFAKRKNNSEFPVEISLCHYRNNDDDFVIAFVVDITVRKSTEAALFRKNEELKEKSELIRQMNLELEKTVETRTLLLKETLVKLEKSKEELNVAFNREKELSELKSRFVSMASHEFRTPLTTIFTSASLALKYALTDDKEKYNRHLLKIQDAVRNLTYILDDFLSLGKLEEGLVTVNPRILPPQDFLEELESIILEMGQVAKTGQHFEFTEAIRCEINTDKKLLRNILFNIISNAIKYSDEDALIKIEAVLENGHLKITVADRGIGISEEDQKHLFERFFRAQNASNIQGTGLGLHIVNRYISLMNGRIEMNSKLNVGSTFTLFFPQPA